MKKTIVFLCVVGALAVGTVDAAALRRDHVLPGGDAVVTEAVDARRALLSMRGPSPGEDGHERRLFSFWKQKFWEPVTKPVAKFGGNTLDWLAKMEPLKIMGVFQQAGHIIAEGGHMALGSVYKFARGTGKVLQGAIVMGWCDTIELEEVVGISSPDNLGWNSKVCKENADRACGVKIGNCDAFLKCLAHQLGLEHKCGVMSVVYAAETMGKTLMIPVAGATKHAASHALTAAHNSRQSAQCLAELSQLCAPTLEKHAKAHLKGSHRTLVNHVGPVDLVAGTRKHCRCVEKRCVPTRGANKGKTMHYPATGSAMGSRQWCFVDDRCDTTQKGNGHSCDGAKFAFTDGWIPAWSKDTAPTYAMPQTEIAVATKYEARANGPTCPAGEILGDAVTCAKAARALGFSDHVIQGTWAHAPKGCFVGHPSDGWRHTYFNAIDGRQGEHHYRSLCLRPKTYGM